MHVYTTPLYPRAVLKTGRQGGLFPQVDLMWHMRHPNILRVLVKGIPQGSRLARLRSHGAHGQSVNDYDATRSVRSHHSCYMAL